MVSMCGAAAQMPRHFSFAFVFAVVVVVMLVIVAGCCCFVCCVVVVCCCFCVVVDLFLTVLILFDVVLF